MNRILFRVDANNKIGMGHIMRCLSIADAFYEVGCQVEFIIADEGVSGVINDRGYKTIVLNSDYTMMEMERWPKDLQAEFTIVDSYFVTAKYLLLLREKMNSSNGKLVYIDDVFSFPYPVDILVNYNVYANSTVYNKMYSDSNVEKPRMILGTKYTPLRSMFRDVDKKKQSKIINNILISTGGADELHVALAIVKSLLSDDAKGLSGNFRTARVYHFLLGTMNSDKDEIKKAVSANEHIIIHENVMDMKTLIESMDLVISAAGSTLYEISACGVPLITYSIADNQLLGAEAFERLGLAVNIGDLRDPKSIDHNSVTGGELNTDAVNRIKTAIDALTLNHENACKMGKQMQEMIDGYGANRMVREILEVKT